MFYQSGAQDLSEKDKEQYKQELTRIMQQHYNFPRCARLEYSPNKLTASTFVLAKNENAM